MTGRDRIAAEQTPPATGTVVGRREFLGGGGGVASHSVPHRARVVVRSRSGDLRRAASPAEGDADRTPEELAPAHHRPRRRRRRFGGDAVA
ncbi:MAG: hypothetical protein AAGN82_23005, partial [Myxococcota bacterium]